MAQAPRLCYMQRSANFIRRGRRERGVPILRRKGDLGNESEAEVLHYLTFSEFHNYLHSSLIILVGILISSSIFPLRSVLNGRTFGTRTSCVQVQRLPVSQNQNNEEKTTTSGETIVGLKKNRMNLIT